MFDAFTKVVAQADARGQFISTSEIDALAAMVSDSNKRLDAVNRISSNASTIVASAARQLFAQQPALNGLRETYLALGTPGASVAAGVNLMKDAALAIVNDKAGIAAGDCASLSSEIGTYFDRAAASVA
jgi:phycocyanin beta chain